MIDAVAIDGRRPLSPALDWESLVAEGRALLGAMSDGRWTDFNAHDPGITLLEAFIYALNDLGYRAGHPISELVKGAVPSQGPEVLLVGNAVTSGDLRRVALDVAGVRNAWIEPSDHPMLRLRYMPGSGELARERDPMDPGDPVRLAGLHRVLIEKSSREDISSAEVVRSVAQSLYRHRGLCEDFDSIDVLAPLAVRVTAELEIDDPARGDAVLLEIYAALADYCSPPSTWLDAAQLRARGWGTERIFEGPATAGRRPDDDGSAPARRVALQLSDVIAALDRIEGVRSVRQVRLGTDDEDLSGPLRWSLPIPSDRIPHFDPRASRILLSSGGGTALDSAAREDLAALFADRVRDAPVPAAAATPAPVRRDRRVADYRPLRLDLPAIYGVAPGALEPQTAPSRRAQVAQLRGYLALLDAMLANHFAQLAGVGALLGSGETPSYFSQPAEPILTPANPGSELPIHVDGFTAETLQGLVEPPASATGLARRNRLLAHLLARYGEEAPITLPPPGLGEGDEVPAARRVLDSRAGFLSAFPRLSSARGTGANLLDSEDEAPLLERIRLKLGLTKEEGARLRLVEHILLRPFAEDDDQAQALLAAASGPDPYSLQLSLVVDLALQSAAESLARVARAETPAHLALNVRWLAAGAFDSFAAAHARWRETLRDQRREALGLDGGAG